MNNKLPQGLQMWPSIGKKSDVNWKRQIVAAAQERARGMLNENRVCSREEPGLALRRVSGCRSSACRVEPSGQGRLCL